MGSGTTEHTESTEKEGERGQALGCAGALMVSRTVSETFSEVASSRTLPGL